MDDSRHEERLADPARLEALDRTGLLDSTVEESFDRLTRLASRIIGAPMGLVSLVSGDRQFFKSSYGLAEPWRGQRGTPLSHSFCQYVVSSDEPLVVADAREHPVLRRNRAVNEMGVIAYAGTPIRTDDGHTIGSFCVLDDQPREWGEAEVEMLRDLAGLVMSQIELSSLAESQRRTLLELERSQERFQAIFRGAPLGVTLISTDDETPGRYEDANPAFTRLVGYSVRELRQRTFIDITHPEHRDTDRAAFLEMRRGDRSVLREEKRYIRKDGSVVWVRIVMTVIRTRSGKATSAVSVIEDITERRAVDRMKDEFISVVSHELRTPLTSIRGSLGLLAGGMFGPLPERGQRMLELATKNTDRLVRLINDMLDIEKIESGAVEMRLRDVDAESAMMEAADSMRSMAAEHGVELVVEPVRRQVRADPDRLEQVFTNLISNAIKFSPPGSRVEVGGRVLDGSVHFHVRDRGRGIPPGQLETIFGRFQQVDASDAREKGGTGLGLAICRSIVDGMGGRIWADSEPQVGSTFFFQLPVVPDPAMDGAPGEAARTDAWVAPSEPPEPLRGGRRPSKVLVVENDDDLSQVLVAVFQERAIEAVRAATGEEAIRRCEVEPPDLVVLDLMLPDGDGLQVVEWLRRQDHLRDVPLVVYSAKDVGEEEAGRLGVEPENLLNKGRTDTVGLADRVTILLQQGVQEGPRR